jgi:hypothetical protein
MWGRFSRAVRRSPRAGKRSLSETPAPEGAPTKSYWQAPGIFAPARKALICEKACCAAGVFFSP